LLEGVVAVAFSATGSFAGESFAVAGVLVVGNGGLAPKPLNLKPVEAGVLDCAAPDVVDPNLKPEEAGLLDCAAPTLVDPKLKPGDAEVPDCIGAELTEPNLKPELAGVLD
jgi:hypothetical protein